MSTLQTFLATQTWYDLALFVFAALFMPAMSFLAGRQLEKEAEGSLVRRYWITIGRGCVGAGAVLGIWIWAGRPFAQLGLDWPIGMRGLAGFLAVALVIVAASLQLSSARTLTGEKLEKALVKVKRIKIMARTERELSLFMLVAVNAGVWEELVYRGFLIWFLTPLLGVVGAVVLSAAIFGVGHIYQGWRGVLTTGLVGLVFATLYALTASLWWLMVVHALIDIYGGLVSYRLLQMGRAVHQTASGVVNPP
jgi:CAAX protease family protein